MARGFHLRREHRALVSQPTLTTLTTLTLILTQTRTLTLTLTLAPTLTRDVARPAPSDGATPAAVAAAGLAPHRLQSYAGSDGEVLHWSPDGGGIAVSGARAAVFDFTGANPPHPYRKGSGAMGQPDPVPRVCMAEAPVQAVAWAPLGAGEEDGGVHAAATLATLGSDGGVRVWRPRGLPLRRGGKRDPSNYPCNPKPSTLDPNPRS